MKRQKFLEGQTIKVELCKRRLALLDDLLVIIHDLLEIHASRPLELNTTKERFLIKSAKTKFKEIDAVYLEEKNNFDGRDGVIERSLTTQSGLWAMQKAIEKLKQRT